MKKKMVVNIFPTRKSNSLPMRCRVGIFMSIGLTKQFIDNLSTKLNSAPFMLVNSLPQKAIIIMSSDHRTKATSCPGVTGSYTDRQTSKENIVRPQDYVYLFFCSVVIER